MIRPISSVRAFTLVEVVVAIGVFALTIVAVVGLLAPVNRSVAEVSDSDRAAQLGDPIQTELVRLRDAESGDRLAAFHQAHFGGGRAVLQLVASRQGPHAVIVTAADNDPLTGQPPGIIRRDRYFLIEVREATGALAYTSGSGFVAMTATIRWPYQVPTGAGANDATDADLTQASSLLLNFALPP